MNIKLFNINNKLINFRKLLSYDYFEFIKLTKERISRNVFLEKYLNNIDLFIKVGTSITQDKIIFILIFKNNKINKLIYNENESYCLEEIYKNIN